MKHPTTHVSAALGLLLVSFGTGATASAQETAQEKDQAAPVATTDESPDARLEAIMNEYDSAMTAFREAYSSAENEEEAQKAINDLYPDPETYVPRLMALARAHPTESAGFGALTWVVGFSSGEQREQALSLLSEHHIESEKIGEVCMNLQYPGSGSAKLGESANEDFLRTVIEKNPSPEVRGRATFSLGMLLPQLANLTADEEASKVAMGEAEELLEKVAAEFGDIKLRGERTMADEASGQLFELRNLAIGKVAPEIDGADLDGVQFKLSDYRGKVVVLDFWGNW